MSEIAKELGDAVAALDVVATNGRKASVQSYQTVPTIGAAAQIRAADYASLIAQRDALRTELADLHVSLATIYNAVPSLPVEPETMDAATDALHAFCLLVGIYKVNIDGDTARQAAGEAP